MCGGSVVEGRGQHYNTGNYTVDISWLANPFCLPALPPREPQLVLQCLGSLKPFIDSLTFIENCYMSGIGLGASEME